MTNKHRKIFLTSIILISGFFLFVGQFRLSHYVINKKAYIVACRLINEIKKGTSISNKTIKIRWLLVGTEIKIIEEDNFYSVTYFEKPFGPFHVYDSKSDAWRYEE